MPKLKGKSFIVIYSGVTIIGSLPIGTKYKVTDVTGNRVSVEIQCPKYFLKRSGLRLRKNVRSVAVGKNENVKYEYGSEEASRIIVKTSFPRTFIEEAVEESLIANMKKEFDFIVCDNCSSNALLTTKHSRYPVLSFDSKEQAQSYLKLFSTYRMFSKEQLALMAKTIEESNLADTTKHHTRTFQNIHDNVLSKIQTQKFAYEGTEEIQRWEKIAC